MIEDINNELCIKFLGNWEHPLTKKFDVKTAFFKSLALDFKLPNSIRYMEGLSGKKYRYLINNLIESVDNARYLEIGSWIGSTACSAMYGNKCRVTCIEDWSMDRVARDRFINNVMLAQHNNVNFQLIEKDFRTIDYNRINRYNIYMFDGPHEEIDQYDGVVISQPALDDDYLLIVDDWNYTRVQDGTKKAIKDLNLDMVASLEITSRSDNQGGKIGSEFSDWHNGYLFAIIKKG